MINVSMAWVLLAVFLLVLSRLWGPELASKIDLGGRLAPASWSHPLGTDLLGRDLWSRVALAICEAVLPLWLAVCTATLLGTALALAVYACSQRRRWSWVACLAESTSTTVVAIPIGITAFAAAVYLQEAGLRGVLLTLSMVLTCRTYLQIGDLVRRDRLLGYWQAHAALGGSPLGRIWHYGCLGRWRSQLAANLAFHLRIAVTIEASLSYLGYGVQEPKPSFGNMLAAHFELYLKGDWYVLAVILTALLLTSAVPYAALTALGRHSRSEP